MKPNNRQQTGHIHLNEWSVLLIVFCDKLNPDNHQNNIIITLLYYQRLLKHAYEVCAKFLACWTSSVCVCAIVFMLNALSPSFSLRQKSRFHLGKLCILYLGNWVWTSPPKQHRLCKAISIFCSLLLSLLCFYGILCFIADNTCGSDIV